MSRRRPSTAAGTLLGAFNTARPCKRKLNRPPSDALALAAELVGAAAADPVIDLEIYRRLTEGELA